MFAPSQHPALGRDDGANIGHRKANVWVRVSVCPYGILQPLWKDSCPLRPLFLLINKRPVTREAHLKQLLSIMLCEGPVGDTDPRALTCKKKKKKHLFPYWRSKMSTHRGNYSVRQSVTNSAIMRDM